MRCGHSEREWGEGCDGLNVYQRSIKDSCRTNLEETYADNHLPFTVPQALPLQNHFRSPHDPSASVSNYNLLPHIRTTVTLHQILKHPKSHILPTNHVPHRRPLLRPNLHLLPPQRLPIRQKARPHNHKAIGPIHNRLLHVPLVLVRVGQKPVIERREEEGHVARAVGDAGGGEGDEEGFLAGGGEGEGGEGGEDVVGGGGADCDFGTRGRDADAADDDIGGAAVEGQDAFAVVGVDDVAFGDGEVGVEGGLRDAFFEKKGRELGGGADD